VKSSGRSVLLALATLSLSGCALLLSFRGFDDGGAEDAGVVESSKPGDAGSPTGDADPNYYGCWRDSMKRDLPFFAYENGVNTIGACIKTCADHNYRYAGAENGVQCWCGNSYGSQGTSGACDASCAGDKSEICGGTYSNSVYGTGVVLDSGTD
jgi:WSC domain